MLRTIFLTALLLGVWLPDSARAQSLFFTSGMGGAGISEGTGLNVTLGGGGMYRRVLGFVNAVEVTMIPTNEGNGPHFYRGTLPNGESHCLDRRTNRPVGTKALEVLCDVTRFHYAATGDVNVLLPGNFFAGGGVRLGSEVTPYASLGFTLQDPAKPLYTFAPFVRGAVGKGLWAATMGAALRLR
jgi:hypothetical protein